MIKFLLLQYLMTTNLILKLIKKNEKSNIMWGTTRSIINSAIIGVSTGHEKILELTWSWI